MKKVHRLVSLVPIVLHSGEEGMFERGSSNRDGHFFSEVVDVEGTAHASEHDSFYKDDVSSIFLIVVKPEAGFHQRPWRMSLFRQLQRQWNANGQNRLTLGRISQTLIFQFAEHNHEVGRV